VASDFQQLALTLMLVGNDEDTTEKRTFFGVYVPALDKTYLIPVSELGKNESCLRLDPLKSHGRTARWAKDYEL